MLALPLRCGFHQTSRTAMPGTKGGGFVFPNIELELPEPNRVVAPNISPDPEYGAGKWKDAVFSTGPAAGNRSRWPDTLSTHALSVLTQSSDEDLASVIVYVRSIAPVHIQRPKTDLTEQVEKTFQPLPALMNVAQPDRSNRIAYGKYLVTVGHCDACHTPTDEQGNSFLGMDLSGGVPLIGAWGPDPKKIYTVASLNLTPDPSGMSYFDEKLFIQVLRTGMVNARPLANIMPWAFFRNLSDDDLGSIFAYLRTLKPVQHRVDNTEPPRYCKVCRSKHGFGDKN